MLIRPLHITQSCEAQGSVLLLMSKPSVLCPFCSRHYNGAKEASPYPREHTFFCYLWFGFLVCVLFAFLFLFFLRLCLTYPRLATNLLWSQRYARTFDFPASISYYYKSAPPCLGHAMLVIAPTASCMLGKHPTNSHRGNCFPPYSFKPGRMYPPYLSFPGI